MEVHSRTGTERLLRVERAGRHVSGLVGISVLLLIQQCCVNPEVTTSAHHVSRVLLETKITAAQLDFKVGSLKPISEGHSFHYGGAPYKCLYGGAPYKSPKIAENR